MGYHAGKPIESVVVYYLIIQLPKYSPEFNPAEYIFNKLKAILRQFKYCKLLKDSLH